MREREAREEILRLGRALYDRGITPGRTGNLSIRCGDRLIATPTGGCLGRLAPEDLSEVHWDGTLVGGRPPTKELGLHRALYEQDPELGAVAHVHSPHAVAWSCLGEDRMPRLTAYFAMRVPELGLVGYHPPGSPHLEEAVRGARTRCVLLAHHGSLAAAGDLESAVEIVEEIEQNAQIALALRHERFAEIPR